jgi:hypothetical protein
MIDKATSPLLHLLNWFSDPLDFLIKLFGSEEQLSREYPLANSMSFICKNLPEFCIFANFFIADADMKASDVERFQVYIAHYPSGGSWRSVDHSAQLLGSGKFQRYDYHEPGAN